MYKDLSKDFLCTDAMTSANSKLLIEFQPGVKEQVKKNMIFLKEEVKNYMNLKVGSGKGMNQEHADALTHLLAVSAEIGDFGASLKLNTGPLLKQQFKTGNISGGFSFSTFHGAVQSFNSMAAKTFVSNGQHSQVNSLILRLTLLMNYRVPPSLICCEVRNNKLGDIYARIHRPELETYVDFSTFKLINLK